MACEFATIFLCPISLHLTMAALMSADQPTAMAQGLASSVQCAIWPASLALGLLAVRLGMLLSAREEERR